MSNLYGSKKTFTILICENCISAYSDMRQEKTHAALIFILLCLNPDHNVSHELLKALTFLKFHKYLFALPSGGCYRCSFYYTSFVTYPISK